MKKLMFFLLCWIFPTILYSQDMAYDMGRVVRDTNRPDEIYDVINSFTDQPVIFVTASGKLYNSVSPNVIETMNVEGRLDSFLNRLRLNGTSKSPIITRNRSNANLFLEIEYFYKTYVKSMGAKDLSWYIVELTKYDLYYSENLVASNTYLDINLYKHVTNSYERIKNGWDSNGYSSLININTKAFGYYEPLIKYNSNYVFTKNDIILLFPDAFRDHTEPFLRMLQRDMLQEGYFIYGNNYEDIDHLVPIVVVINEFVEAEYVEFILSFIFYSENDKPLELLATFGFKCNINELLKYQNGLLELYNNYLGGDSQEFTFQ